MDGWAIAVFFFKPPRCGYEEHGDDDRSDSRFDVVRRVFVRHIGTGPPTPEHNRNPPQPNSSRSMIDLRENPTHGAADRTTTDAKPYHGSEFLSLCRHDYSKSKRTGKP
jgi:hypothetical protein